MYKNLTTTQLILIALAAMLLLVAAFAFYLLQDPAAPLPFIPPPATSTVTQIPAFTGTPLIPTPTHRTSYTPLAAFQTPQLGTPGGQSTQLGTPSSYPPPASGTSRATPVASSSPGQATQGNPYPIRTATTPAPRPSVTTGPTVTGTPPTPTKTSSVSPTATRTLAPGEISVTGRIVQNATPVANVLVTFADDTAPRQSRTDSGGHYSFTTLAPGTSFILTFNQTDNPNLTPPAEIASRIYIEGTLPQGVNPIDIPDMEISINLLGIIFEPQMPVDGAAYSASSINSSYPLQFIWTLYSLGGSYHVELGPNGSDEPIWTSPLLAASNYSWDGTLDDGSHITQGSYWWRVSVTKSLGNYVEVIYTQPFDILFNP
jgi:hypothetical protein